MAALLEGIGTGAVALGPPPEEDTVVKDPATALRLRADQLLAICADTDRAARAVAIGGCPMTTALVTTAGALEIAVHGWDIGRSCGAARPVPPALAAELLCLAPTLVPGAAERAPLFGEPVPVPRSAPPGDRLVAFLGREPG